MQLTQLRRTSLAAAVLCAAAGISLLAPGMGAGGQTDAHAGKGGAPAKPLSKFVDTYPSGAPKTAAEQKAWLKKAGLLNSKTPPASETHVPSSDRGSRGAFGTVSGGPGYVGMTNFNYYNNDGPRGNEWRSCGQAAAATLLRYYGVKFVNDNSNRPVSELYAKYPADGFLAGVGTSWQRVQTMLNANGLKTSFIHGEAALKQSIRNHDPVIVMLDIGKCPEWGKWGGHWTVAYGFNNDRIYLSNWEGKTDSTLTTHFRDAWNNPLTVAGGFANYGIVAHR